VHAGAFEACADDELAAGLDDGAGDTQPLCAEARVLAERLVAQTPQLLIVEDIAPDGRVLARSDDWPEIMMCQPPGASREVNLTWLDFSEGVALSADGQDLLFIEGGAGAGATGGVYMRKTDGSTAAVRLGDGGTASRISRPTRSGSCSASPTT